MQHGAVADMSIFLDNGVGAGEAMHHATVLHVAARFEHDAAEIAAQAGRRSDIAARADDHIAGQDRSRMHERARIDDRHEAVNFVEGTRGPQACQRRCTL